MSSHEELPPQSKHDDVFKMMHLVGDLWRDFQRQDFCLRGILCRNREGAARMKLVERLQVPAKILDGHFFGSHVAGNMNRDWQSDGSARECVCR